MSKRKMIHDIFLSYRVNSDAKLAEEIYNKLTTQGIKVFFDKANLITGLDWEDGFVDGLNNSRIFITIISRKSIKEQFEKLLPSSRCDNVLLEYYLALMYSEFYSLERICPIFVGDKEGNPDDIFNGKYGDYFTQGCSPNCPNIIVKEIEDKLFGHLQRQGLSNHINNNITVKEVMMKFCRKQGLFLKGDNLNQALTLILNKISIMIKELPNDFIRTQIELSDLKPVINMKEKSGSFGIVYFANWYRYKSLPPIKVGIKVLKINDAGLSQKGLLEAEKIFLEEAINLQQASNDGMNQYILKFYGVISGKVTDEWLTRLDINAPSVLIDSIDSNNIKSKKMFGFVLGYVGGGTLVDILHNNPNGSWICSTLEKITFINKVIQGLLHLHNNNIECRIIHGDLKPENILLDIHGNQINPRIADFGLSESVKNTSANSRISTAKSTNETRGTYPYMAIEMFRRRENGSIIQPVSASRSTDIYALGVIMWEILTNSLPWKDCIDKADMIHAIQSGETLDMDKIPSDVPNEIKKLISLCLSNNRETRPKIHHLFVSFEQICNEIAKENYDIFLSSSITHHSLASKIYSSLYLSGYKVFLNNSNFNEDIKNKIIHSDSIVILVSQEYLSNNENMMELNYAIEQNKLLIICIVEPSRNNFLIRNSSIRKKIIKLLNLNENDTFVDLTAASHVDWSSDDISPEDSKLLTDDPSALQLLRKKLYNLKQIKHSNLINITTDDDNTIEWIESNDIISQFVETKNEIQAKSKLIKTKINERNILITKGNKSIALDTIGKNIKIAINNNNMDELTLLANAWCGNKILDHIDNNFFGIFSSGFAPIHYCIINNNLQSLQILYDYGANLNTVTTNEGNSSLHLAVNDNKIDILIFLVSRGCDRLIMNKNGHIPLSLNITDEIYLLLDCPVSYFIKYNQIDNLLMIFNFDENLFKKDKYGLAAIHYACQFGNIVGLLLLFDKKVSLDIPCNVDNKTPAHYAVENDHVDILKFLILKGIDVNINANNNMNILHYASKYNQMLCMKHLIENNILLVTITNHIGQTLLHLCLNNSNKSIECMKYILINCSAIINNIDNNGNTALHLACLNNLSSHAEILINYQINLLIENNDGLIALDLCRDDHMWTIVATEKDKKIRQVRVAKIRSNDVTSFAVSNDRAVNDGNVLTLKGHSKWVNSVAISKDGSRIISGSEDKSIKVWDAINGGDALLTLIGHIDFVYSVAISNDVTKIFSGSNDMSIKVWDMNYGTLLLTLLGHTNGIESVAISNDGKILISGSDDNSIKVWDANKGGNALLTLIGHTKAVSSVAISKDGSRIISGSGDKSIKVWDAINGGDALLTFIGHSDFVTSVAISNDGLKIVSCSEDNSIKVWDAINEELSLFTLLGHTDIVNSVVFSSDGTYLISGSNDKSIKVWDAINGGDELLTFLGHTGDVTSVAISNDGTFIISGSVDESIKVWDVINNKSL